VDRPAVVELVKSFARGELPHGAAQAAVWHLNNDVSWDALAAKRRGPKRALAPQLPYFAADEMRLAVRIAAESVRRAGPTGIESTQAEPTLSRY
jgi:hypothetical protein